MKRLSSALALIAICIATPAYAENLEQTQQLMDTKQCQRCDLSGVGLIYANLSGANLSDANLSQANLSRVNLSSATLRNANLSGAVLYSANLSGADLSGANLSGVDLRNAILSGAKLQGAKLDGANLLGATGLPTEVATPTNYYLWGMAEAQRGNYRGAINDYDQALTIQPDFAHVYLARGISKLRLSDQAGAIQDAQHAEQLYIAQGDEQGRQAATQFYQGIQAMQEAQAKADRDSQRGGKGNFLNFLSGLAGLALQLGSSYFLPFR